MSRTPALFRFRRPRFAVALFALTTAVIVAPALAQTADSSFPFPIPFENALNGSAPDVSFLNDAPLSGASRLMARDGHFYTKAGKRVRFVGVNLGAPSCFPPKKDAPLIAARLAKFGVNLARLHHMDAPWPVPNIFYVDKDAYGKPTLQIDPRTLDRLDFFVAELKKRGVYADLNLHVSRLWSAENGFPQDGKLPDLGKVVAYFDPKAIQLQKEYATALLRHKNPYTGLTYAQDPVIAIVEMNNEDSLVGQGGDGLPPSYRAQLKMQWNRFLRAKYATTAALRKNWNAAAEPMGENLLKNARLESGTDGWTAETHDATTMRLEAESPAGQTNAPEGRALRVTGIKTDGTNWHLQLHQTGLDLKPGKKYTLSFVAKSSAPRPLWMNSRLDQEPWTFTGLDTNVGLSAQWRRYAYTFTANNAVVANHCRVSWTVGDSDSDFWLGDLSLRPGGGGSSLPDGETVEAGNIEIPGVNDSAAGRDYTACLSQIEQDYTDAMKGAVRATGCPAPLTCSQASYGGTAGVLRESRLDYVDMHSYWQHPSFPGVGFDFNNYRIENTAMVASPALGILDGLAMHRVAGKPFTVSEYDHPAPTEYAAEMTPFIFAYAARQDWDGVFLFAYESDRAAGDKIGSWFDVGRHPAKMAFLPWAALAFRRGDIPPLTAWMALSVSPADLIALKAKGTDYTFWNAVAAKIGPRDFLTKRAAIAVDPKATTPKVVSLTPAIIEPSAALNWDAAQRLVTVDTPKSKALIGFLPDKLQLDGLKLFFDPTKAKFASIALTALDDKPIKASKRLLLTICGSANNPGLVWNAERTFAQNTWAAGPPRAIVPEGDIELATEMKSPVVYALEGTGKRIGVVSSRAGGPKGLTFQIGHQHPVIQVISRNQTTVVAPPPPLPTLWYEIVEK